MDLCRECKRIVVMEYGANGKFQCKECGTDIPDTPMTKEIRELIAGEFIEVDYKAVEVRHTPGIFMVTGRGHEKPVIGLVPQYIREDQRIQEVAEAINRYEEAGLEVPREWKDEFYLLILRRRLRK